MFLNLLATLLLFIASPALSQDPNESAAPGRVPTIDAQLLPGDNVTATFPGGAGSFAINLRLTNNTTASNVIFQVRGQIAVQCPLVWDSFGTYAGAATLVSLTGVDDPSGIVTVNLSGFAPGTSVSFTGIDPDCVGDPSAGITVDGIAGSRALVLTTQGLGLGTKKFAFNGDGTSATVK